MSYVPRNSWVRLYDIDWTAQATQNMKPDATATIDGISWTSENMASASAGGVTNGTGFAITCSAGAANYGDNVRTAPLMRANLSDIIDDVLLGQSKALRFGFRVTLTNADTNFEFAKSGIERAGTPAQFHSVIGRGYNTGNIIIEGQLSTSATSTRSGATSSDDYLEMIWKPHWNFDYRHTAWPGTGQPPRTSTFITALTSTLGSNYLRDATDGLTTTQHLRLIMCAHPTGSANTFTATWTHMFIDRLVG